ncbi:MAG: glycoside hydrolase family 95 protein [Clostridia bacterium]|nr:glycoside hydrolase family 95 protein [Clostridia bacterium]
MKENRLYYDAPAQDWHEALPLGNGRLGMMVFGGISEEHVQLNEESVWSGWECPEYNNPHTYEHLEEIRRLVFSGKYSSAQELCDKYLVCRGLGHNDITGAFGSYQTAGDLYIQLPEAHAQEYSRELILDEGRAEVCFSGVKREYIVSYKYNTAAIKLPGVRDARVRYERQNAAVIEGDGEISARAFLPTEFALLVKYEYAPDAMYIYITAATSYKTDEKPMAACRRTLARAMEAGYERLKAETKDYFTEMLGRAGVSFGVSGTKAGVPTDKRILAPEDDPELAELYFNYGRYLLIASSRGKLPANLQGIWCKDYRPAWSADYHININIQMNYWFAEQVNLPELMEPFFDLIRLIAKSGETTAREIYHCPGWAAHFDTNPWGYTALGLNPLYGAFVTAGAWCLRHVKERYLFSCDTGILREFYPIIRGACEFFLAYLCTDPRTGYLVAAPASSPENTFVSPEDGRRINICAGTAIDTSIIRELFTFAADTMRMLSLDSELAGKISAALKKLPPLKTGRHGQVVEWNEDFEEYEPGHRHMSQLYGLYPANEITSAEPELFASAKRTIARRLAHGGGHTGWSRAWIINFFARLRDGENAHRNLLALF